MIILGLHFGHDGSASVIKDGEIRAFVMRERHARVKHAIGVTSKEVELALFRAGLSIQDIECVALVSTQNIEMFDGLVDELSITFKRHSDDQVPAPLADILQRDGIDIDQHVTRSLSTLIKEADGTSHQYAMYSKMLPELEAVRADQITSTGWLDNFVNLPSWLDGRGLSDIADLDCSQTLRTPEIRYGFHYPATVTLKGRAIPAQLVNHHVAHAASSFYRSPFANAAIITHDGFVSGQGYHSGMVFYGDQNHISPLTPHHLEIGTLYDRVGLALNLGEIGPAGKLMGLAPYGKPVFFDEDFVGNTFDVEQRRGENQSDAWLKHCQQMAKKLKYDMAPLGDKARITEAVNVDIAASTQKLFEETYLLTVRATHALCANTSLSNRALCLSGGTALNCPSNSRILNEGPFDEVFIEPHCSDDGLAIGAALYIHHHLHDMPRQANSESFPTPYLGAAYSAKDIADALHEFAALIEVIEVDHPALAAAQDLHANQIIAWFEGGSEAGPRALGHRSMLANPRHAENWRRVNEVKSREHWRPFAPAVLAEEAHNWFSGLPVQSPYMLFTGQVTGETIPAIKHVDGSARVQTVDATVGEFYTLIREFFALSGIPVVLNTSLNGPREPIVENPHEALSLLVRTNMDALYIGDFRVRRKG